MKKKGHQKIFQIFMLMLGLLREAQAQGQSCANLTCPGTCACRFIEFDVKFDNCECLSDQSPCEARPTETCDVEAPFFYECVDILIENSGGGEELDKLCTCPLGRATHFDLSTFSLVCIDVDECSSGEHNCGSTAICANTDGSYICEDIDECSEGTHNCAASETCLNHEDGFSCQINDMCAVLQPCHERATCENTDDGSYICTCASGFEGDGEISCEDINECTSGGWPRGGCDWWGNGGKCINEIGSHRCNCANGYQGDGENCEDIDECKEKTHSCAEDSKCSNSPGSYSCQCLTGFSGDAYLACDDINECLNSPCAENASCSNTRGSFSCSCNSGFAGDPRTSCEDINECEGDHGCPVNSRCTNLEGSFKCEGFAMKNGRFEDIDECANNPCHHNANCVNNDGSFDCICQDGYHGDGFVCDLTVNCFVDNGGCSHFCNIPSGCSCPGSCWNLDSDNKTCVPDVEKSEMQCLPGSMDISIDGCLFEDGKNYELQMIDPNCILSKNGGFFELEVDFDECGTYIDKMNGQVLMSQKVQAMTGDPLSQIIEEFDFECSYNSTYIVAASTRLELDDTPLEVKSETEEGIFDFSLNLFSNDEFVEKLSEDDVINVGEKAFFAIQAENFPESLYFFVQKCSIEEIGTSSSFDIISSPGCNNLITSTSSPDPYITSGAGMKRFEFQSFTFTSSTKAIAEEILKCEIQVCLQDECPETAACGTANSVRRRRDNY
ncbi:Oidioi.mRNA.OKI2018_I69.chr1.g219.t1.cds [Oikopleura dioica]|uniref:Oidioi.mRNA.OKI2018_I69.chr1.g219.t1.cds n=1 Tax=Oikopleura dioica TaxID=34765 RepID=A0ABN7SNN2_OIKDI|nr:Oidioi.mRNA.OKI2018_I69.chr1.g219.t1.cds [Oikopleura dioica]